MKKILIFIIRFYRKRISRLKKPCCRFRPTCSAYAIEAIQKHGAFLGSLMAVSRVIRCNPYNPGGYDPVPDKFSLRGNRGRKNEPSVCEKCEKKAECSGEDCFLLEQSQNKGE